VSTHEVVIIGAGPYGLSISAHLRGLGIDHVIVGKPMDTWRAHMPVGMNLKSEPYASDMSSPRSGYDVAAYCQSHGLDHVARVGPLSLERFLAYADWYTEQLVPDVRDLTVTQVDSAGGRFQVAFTETESVTAAKVVVATGVLPHRFIPAELAGLPADLVSHTSDHHQLDRFRGRKVAVIGAGQSGLETAALLHEAGAEVRLIVRGTELDWHPYPPALRRIRRPMTKLCEGWRCAFWHTPRAFRRLPEEMRVTKARTVLGPCGAWWLRDRVEGVIEVMTGTQVRSAEAAGSGVLLQLDGPGQPALEVDHVMAGTGFHMDVANLSFLQRQLPRIETVRTYPAVSLVGESTVPGLYFAGAQVSASLGPGTRFIGGTHSSVGPLAASLARRVKAAGRTPRVAERVS